eukprot:6458226-Amphidinium_carterae.1
MTLRPEDARMWCAMAQCFDFMHRKVEALKCYAKPQPSVKLDCKGEQSLLKAHRCDDRERMALPRLARLYQETVSLIRSLFNS